MSEEIKWIYLAGVIDSSGCILLDSRGNFRISFEVNSSDALLKKYLLNNFGGVSYNRSNGNRGYTWRPSAITLDDIVTHVLPYLHAKNYELILLQEYRKTIFPKGKRNTLTAEILDKRLEIFTQLQEYQQSTKQR